MILAPLFALVFVLQASFSEAFVARDIDGSWRSLSSFRWEKRAQPGDVLRLALTNNNDRSYAVAVRMGTPFQEIQMAVSLGQNHIVVASPNTTSQVGYYISSSSSTFVAGSVTTGITGLDGSLTTARFAGESCQILDFNYNASLAITPSAPNLYHAGTTGILGYGVDPAPFTPDDSTLLKAYLPPSLIQSGGTAVCGIELNRASDGGQGGIFTMGGLDTAAFTGGFTTMQVPAATSRNRPSWSIPLDSVSFSAGGNSQSKFAIAGGIASIDPYYPTISIPPSDVSRLYSIVVGAAVSPSSPNRYTVPCNAEIRITMVFGAQEFALDARDAITTEGGTCYGTVEASQDGIFRVGSPLMRNVYTSFGAQFNTTPPKFTVGFARRSNQPSSATRNGVRPGIVAAIAIITFICGIVLTMAVVVLVRRRMIRRPREPRTDPRIDLTGRAQTPRTDISALQQQTPDTGPIWGTHTGPVFLGSTHALQPFDARNLSGGTSPSPLGSPERSPPRQAYSGDFLLAGTSATEMAPQVAQSYPVDHPPLESPVLGLHVVSRAHPSYKDSDPPPPFSPGSQMRDFG